MPRTELEHVLALRRDLQSLHRELASLASACRHLRRCMTGAHLRIVDDHLDALSVALGVAAARVAPALVALARRESGAREIERQRPRPAITASIMADGGRAKMVRPRIWDAQMVSLSVRKGPAPSRVRVYTRAGGVALSVALLPQGLLCTDEEITDDIVARAVDRLDVRIDGEDGEVHEISIRDVTGVLLCSYGAPKDEIYLFVHGLEKRPIYTAHFAGGCLKNAGVAVGATAPSDLGGQKLADRPVERAPYSPNDDPLSSLGVFLLEAALSLTLPTLTFRDSSLAELVASMDTVQDILKRLSGERARLQDAVDQATDLA